MKRVTALVFALVLSLSLISLPVFAAFTTETSAKGLPYDDYKKYTYFVKQKSITGTEEGSTEMSFVYEVHVRDAKTSKILSLDTFEVKLSNLPNQSNTYDKYNFSVTVEPLNEWPGITVERTVDYSYGAVIGEGGSGYKKGNWKDYKKSIKSSTENTSKEGTFMGRPALYLTYPSYGTETSSRLLLQENSDVIVYFKDIIIPNGIFLLSINYGQKADGSFDLFNDYPDYQRRVNDVKEQVKTIYNQSQDKTKAQLNTYENIKVTTKKTAEVRTYQKDNSDWNLNMNYNSDASKSAGETDVTIPAMIVIGAAGLAAAAAGIAAAGTTGKNENGDSESEKKSTYKMHIYKEFGDSIRLDKPAVIVYARISEINAEGVEIERLDLTQQITIFSNDSHMKIGEPTIAGNYMGSTVEAEKPASGDIPTEGAVSFGYSGEGGTFQNNVKFKLVGEPFIKFDEQGENLYMDEIMIKGDNGDYIVPFSLHDFIEVPTVSIKLQENGPFEVELEKVNDYNYKAIVHNQSVKSDKVNAQSEMMNVEVIAENESETEYKSDSFRVTLYPEGLSVSIVKFDENGYAQIGAYADKEKIEGGEEVLATRFKVDLAVSSVDEKGNKKAEIVNLSNTDIKFDILKGQNTQTENLVKIFKYEIVDTSNAGIYKFQPKKQIPEGDTNLYLLLPISCEYQNIPYSLDLPIRLIGEPFNEMMAKKKELDLLLKRIKRYMPPEQWSDVIDHIKENYDNMSPKEIRLLNKSLYEITARKLLDEAQEDINYAETLDWVIWGLEWVKWIGDQAFSYVAMVYTGPVGEALLSPTKEILVGLISENIWYREGISNPADKLRNVNKNLMSMLENSLMTQINSDTGLKKAGFILASFTVIKIVNHYYNDVGADGKPIGFYDAILAGLGDLTSNAFKFVISEKFDELVKSPKATEYFNKYVSDWMKKFLDANAAGWQEKGVAVIKKYVEELCGSGAATVYNKASQTEIDTKTGGLIININIWDDPKDNNNSIIVSVDVLKIKDKLYNYIFDSMFGSFPFQTSQLKPPADPIFINK